MKAFSIIMRQKKYINETVMGMYNKYVPGKQYNFLRPHKDKKSYSC